MSDLRWLVLCLIGLSMTGCESTGNPWRKFLAVEQVHPSIASDSVVVRWGDQAAIAAERRSHPMIAWSSFYTTEEQSQSPTDQLRSIGASIGADLVLWSQSQDGTMQVAVRVPTGQPSYVPAQSSPAPSSYSVQAQTTTTGTGSYQTRGTVTPQYTGGSGAGNAWTQGMAQGAAMANSYRTEYVDRPRLAYFAAFFRTQPDSSQSK
jgi:hypothetical protein